MVLKRAAARQPFLYAEVDKFQFIVLRTNKSVIARRDEVPTWQSPLEIIETPEIATPVCALVRNDNTDRLPDKLQFDKNTARWHFHRAEIYV